MNRHQQEAKKYLSQAFGLNQRIESKLGQIEDLHDLATKATVTYSDMPKNPNRDAINEALEIERFFRSGWYSQLTSVDGEYLIRRLQEEVRQSESIRGRKHKPIGGAT